MNNFEDILILNHFMMINKLKVAVTGSIGSGKSLFCSLLMKKGYPVISADSESKSILANDAAVKKEVIKTFGEESFINGTINKVFLAQTIFSDPENVAKINSILHPHVIKKVQSLINQNQQKHDIVFAEAALIYEADMESLFDYVVLVTAAEKTRMQRKINTDGFTQEDFLKRNSNQIPDEEKKKRADFVFVNDGTPEDLEKKAELLITILKGISNSNPA